MQFLLGNPTIVPMRKARAVLPAALVLLLIAASAPAASAGPGQTAPATSVSADGRTVAGAGKSLSASMTQGLAATGQAVTVGGTGFDVTKGIYVTVCVIPPAGTIPSPCGGGQDEATSGSGWVSSNPPSYAEGSTTPYGPNGSFQLALTLTPDISPAVNCLQVRCALVTRNDHTRTSDRSQDLILPITFAAPAATTPGTPVDTTPTTAPALPSTTTTTLAPKPTDFAPAATLAADGRSTRDATRTVTVSQAAALDPVSATVTVTGTGFDSAVGVYVSLCAIPAANQAPSPCATGADRAVWLSSSPPDYGQDLARPFDVGGAFDIELTLDPQIDGETDCRKLACAITVRRDDTARDDRTSDLFVPVSFATESTTTTAEPTSTTAARADDETAGAVGSGGGTDGSGGGPLPFVLGGLLVALAAAGVVLWRRRLAAGPAGPAGPASPTGAAGSAS